MWFKTREDHDTSGTKLSVAGGPAESGPPSNSLNVRLGGRKTADERTPIYVRKRAPEGKERRGNKKRMKSEQEQIEAEERGDSGRREDERKEAWQQL